MGPTSDALVLDLAGWGFLYSLGRSPPAVKNGGLAQEVRQLGRCLGRCLVDTCIIRSLYVIVALRLWYVWRCVAGKLRQHILTYKNLQKASVCAHCCFHLHSCISPKSSMKKCGALKQSNGCKPAIWQGKETSKG